MQKIQIVLCSFLILSNVAVRGSDLANKYSIMFAEYGKGPNRLVEVSKEGKMVWEHKFPSISVIFQVLPNGNVVYAYGGKPTGVQEINRKGEVVWNYESRCPQVLGCERLKNGNTLIAEQGPCQVVEVDKAGNTIRVTPLKTIDNMHLQVRNVHKLPNGNILAAHEGEGVIREYAPDGAIVWEYTGVENTGEAIRLPNGNTVIACGTQKRVIEVTPDKQIVWQFTAEDAPEVNLTWVSSLQFLNNGNLVIGNFLRGQEGKGAHAFEINRKKEVLWKWSDHEIVKSLTTVRVLQ